MYRKITLNIFGALTIALFLATVTGMIAQGAHRWVQPLEQAAWISFVITVLSFFLFAGPGPGRLTVTSRRWRAWAMAAGAVSVALFVTAIVAYAVSSSPYAWIEAIELAGILSMVVTVISCIMATGGFGRATGN